MVSGLATKCLAEVFSSRVGMGGSLKDGGQGRALPIFRILFCMNDPGVEMFAFFQSHAMLSCINPTKILILHIVCIFSFSPSSSAVPHLHK